MASKQKESARKNIKGRRRAKPGTKGEGDYFRIIVRPKEQFISFRYHDVGEDNGDLQRLAGRRASGSWTTQAWLISKNSAHEQGNTLIGDTKDARKLLETLGSKPVHVKGDNYKAKSRPNIPEESKPTKAQKARWF